MRNIFIDVLTELAQKDPRIVLLTGDLGYTVLEPFKERFPNRFFNVGVAEQNMVGVATGLAGSGFVPYLYSIINFAVLRPYEFIRNGPIAHHLPVRIVGVGGGFDYGPAGITHYGLEDIAMLRIQKGITVVVPADSQQAKTAFLKTWDLPGPVYYRIGKGDKSTIANLNGQFELGKINEVRKGKDLIFISTGSITKEVMTAADLLAAEGISSNVVVVSSFNPSPVEDLAKTLKSFRIAFTVEDHYITGGLGSFVSEVVSEHKVPCRVVRCGVKSLVNGSIGSKNYMNDKYELSGQKLFETALRSLKRFKE